MSAKNQFQVDTNHAVLTSSGRVTQQKRRSWKRVAPKGLALKAGGSSKGKSVSIKQVSAAEMTEAFGGTTNKVKKPVRGALVVKAKDVSPEQVAVIKEQFNASIVAPRRRSIGSHGA